MRKIIYPHLWGQTRTLPNKPKGVKRLVAERELQKQQELLYALERVSHVLTVEIHLQKILEDMATIVAKAVGAKWVNFWELTPDKKATYIKAAYGMQQSYIEQSRKHPIKIGKAWIGRAIKTGKAWGTNDILADPHLMHDLGSTWKQAVKKQDYHALLCVPTTSRKGIVGGMCVYYPERHAFTDFEMRLITIAANQAATAITNAQIFDDLVAEQNKTVATLNSLADGLIVYDLENKITAFNPKAEELLWISRNAVLQKDPAKLPLSLLGKRKEFQNLKDISSLPLREFESQEITLTEPQRVHLLITLLPLREAESRKIGFMRILHDISKEKETELMKSSFISIASHQLRTPLSGIKWALALLGEETAQSLSKQHRDLIAKTYQTNEHLIALVNDLLDTSRIEEGRFGYEFRKTSLVQMVREALGELESLIKEKPAIKVSFKSPQALIPFISADSRKLKMALYNILDNAVKYTLRGDITITLRITRTSLNLYIRDEGIGIPKEQQKFLFTKFFRARNAILLQTEGSGLGLWIANEIIKRHKGKIILVESAENEGATFLVRLPIEPKEIPKGKIKGL